MPEEERLKTEEEGPRTEVAEALRDAADQIESGDVTVVSDAEEQTVTVPERPRFEIEHERRTGSETGNDGTNSNTRVGGRNSTVGMLHPPSVSCTRLLSAFEDFNRAGGP